MYNPKRHEEVSTVIVDYEMPSMKGLEFCEKIKNPYLRKILYTGAADEGIAVKAFNEGIIDGYIKKQDPHKKDTINNLVRTNQLKYFQSLTNVLVGSIFKEITSKDPKETAFYDPAFINYFNRFVEKHNICEYYMNEIVGGFVCLSSQGEVSLLFTYTEQTLEENKINAYSVLNQVSADPHSAALINDIEEKRKALCFPFWGELLEITPQNWRAAGSSNRSTCWIAARNPMARSRSSSRRWNARRS